MQVRVRACWRQKAGNAPDEYEDAFWPETPICLQTPGVFRCAVADGATETSFSGLWARLLTEAWGTGRLGRRRFARSLVPLQRVWRETAAAGPLPWYAEEKLRMGAYAALASLSVADEGSWKALAIGDCCLFHLRGRELLRAFPLTEPEQFDSRPLLLGSNGAPSDQVRAAIRSAAGKWRPGDIFYLMTDALACWFLHSGPLSQPPELTQDCFAAWIYDLRSQGAIRNDDVTLVRVDLA